MCTVIVNWLKKDWNGMFTLTIHDDKESKHNEKDN